jgi:hypothetical protein
VQGLNFGYQDVAVDPNGNVFLPLLIAGPADLDPTLGVDVHTAVGLVDVAVTKLTASGDYAWSRSFGGLDYDYVDGAVVDEQGSVFLAGGFKGTVDFDPTAGVDLHTAIDNPGTAQLDYNAFVTKLYADGSYAWSVTFGGGSGASGVSRIARDLGGNLLVVGGFSGEVDFDPGVSVQLHRATGVSQDIFVSKFDADGNHNWTRTFGGAAADAGTGIAVDPQGNVFAVGTFRAVADFDPGPGTDNHYQEGFIEDIYLTKLYSDGGYAWTRTWPVVFRTAIGRVASDGGGNAVITGGFNGTVDFDPTDGVDLHTSAGGAYSGFVTQIKADGSYGWTAAFLGTSRTYGLSIAADAQGGVYVTGEFSGTTDFDPGDGVASRRPASVDGFIVRLTPAGGLDWLRTIGGPSSDLCYEIGLGPDNAVHVVGHFQSAVDLDPGCATEIHTTPQGHSDDFILKLGCVNSTPDFDGDGAVDLRDLAAFQNCFTGDPPTACPSGCESLDFDHDSDIDLSDYYELQRVFAGP